jgi:hypothetical protein
MFAHQHKFFCNISFFINIKPICLKLWISTNLNMVFPVVVLVVDINESSEGVLHGRTRRNMRVEFVVDSLRFSSLRKNQHF